MRSEGWCKPARSAARDSASESSAAQAEHDLQRVLIVDFDVHHGNGTQDAFYDDGSVLFFSTHQYPFYPGTGHWRDTGRGAGKGATVNVPFPAGVGDAGYAQAFDEVLWPAARRFDPQVILVSAGYDAHWNDPLANMQLTIPGYATLVTKLLEMADVLCDGRIVFVLEGGYHLEVLSHAVLNTVRQLSGQLTEVSDPLGPCPWEERDAGNIIAQAPKLKPYKSQMESRIASLLEIETRRVNVKAKTNEGMDAVGRQEAIATQAVVLIKPAQ